MKILRIALWTLLLVVAVLAGALAYLPVYLQDHQAILETAATRALGRQVEIGGLALTWSLHPYPALAVALQGLRVRNPDWARGPDLLSAAQVDVQFDLRAFLQRTIVVERLVVHGADLQLETGADGQENWHFSGGGSDAGILRLSSLRALDSTVAFQSALVPTPQGAWQAAVTRLDLGGLDGGQTLLDAELVYAETPVSLKADAGQTDASASARWPFQIQAQVAGADLQVHGSAAAPFDPADLDAAVDLQGPTPAPLGRLLRIDGLPDGPFQFKFELTRRNQDLQLSGLAGSVDSSALPTPVRVTGGDAALSGDGSRLRLQVSGQSLAMLSPLLRVELPAQPFTAAARLEGRPRRSDLLDLKATSGDSDIAGQLRIEFGLQPRVDALLTAQQLDLSAFVDPSGRMADGDAINRPAAKAKASTSIAGLDPRWKAKAAQTLPLEWLRRFDSELHLSAGHVHFGDFGVDNARLDTMLDAGHLVLTARAGQERLSATLDVRPEPDPVADRSAAQG